MYSELLENPRRRRRSRRRRTSSRRRRRSNPMAELRTNPRRRRRSRSRRRGRSARGRRRNPFRIPGLGGLGGGLGQTLGQGARLWLFEVTGGTAMRALLKLLPQAQQTQTVFRFVRAGIGILAPMLLGKLIPRQWAVEFGSVQVAQALRNWSSNSPMFAKLGLSDFVTTEDLSDDYGLLDNGDGYFVEQGGIDEQGNVMLDDFVTVPEYA